MSRFSVKKPLTIFVAVFAIAVLGIVAYTRMTPNLLPDMDLPYVVVVTTYPGATPEEVEAEVTKPIEQSMATLENIETVSSSSSENYSLVILEFATGANMESISVDIMQSLSQLEGTWDDLVGAPYIMKLNPDMMPVVVASVDMEGMDTAELSVFVKDTLMTQLEGVSGVASVAASGVIEESVNVLLSQDHIDSLNKKILASIDGSFDEAVGELNDGIAELEDQQAQIDSGMNDLETGKNALIDGTSDASGIITESQTELIQGKILLTEQLAALQAQLTELKTTEAQLRSLQDTIDTLEAADAQLATSIQLLKDLKTSVAMLQSAMDSFDAAIAAIESSTALTDAQKTEQINQIKTGAEYLQTVGALSEIDAQLRVRGLTRDTIDDGIAQMETARTEVTNGLQALDSTLAGLGMTRADVPTALSEVTSGIAQLEAGIATLNATLAGLEGGSVQLSAAMAELERQKTTGILTLSSSTTQLLLGSATISAYLSEAEAGLEQIQDAREAAYSQADLTNIITMDMVSNILAAQNFSMPAGYVTEGGVSYLVRVGDTLASTDEMGDLLLLDLKMDGVDPIYLSDVADIFVSDNADEIYARINDHDGVVLSFSKQSNVSTAEASDNVKDKMDALSETYEGLTFTNLMDQGNYIYLIMNSIIENLALGALFAVIILFLFLRDLRPTVITLISIPASVLFALVLMYFSGVTLNMFSLSGLAVAVGMLVDNSIVVIENIFRLRNKGETPIKAAVSGAMQVSGAVTASTLTTICVFLPIVFVDGLTRQLFTDFALTFAYALIASLIIALTLVPAMSSGMLNKIKRDKQDGAWSRVMGLYRRTLRWTLRHKAISLVCVLILLVGSGALLIARGFSFMPDMDMGQISATLEMPKGATFDETVALSDTIVDRIEALEDVDTVGALISGDGVSLLGASGDGTVSMYILLNEKSRATADVVSDIEALTADLDCELEISSTGSMDLSSLTGTGVTVDLYGEDLDTLRASATDVATRLRSVDGVSEVSDGLEESDPAIKITVDKNRAMAEGLTVATIYQEISKMLTLETTATTLTYDGDTYDVIVQNGQEEEITPDYIRNYIFTVTGTDGEEREVPLTDVAVVSDSESLSSINRSEQKRYVTVTAEVDENSNVTRVASRVTSSMADYSLPDGVTYEITGESEAIMDSMVDLIQMLALGILLVYLVMVAQFQSLKSPFIIMFTIPLAFTGGFIALLLAGYEISIISMIGFVMLVGIIVNNGIVLVDYVNQLRIEGLSTEEALVEAGVTRMRPVLMTTLTTICGLIFTAVGIGQGSAMMQPIAVVCIGGLAYATLMTLYIVPVLYRLLNRKEMRIINEEDLILSEK